MSKVRTISRGSSPVYAVDHVDDDGEVSESTFFDLCEARRFSAEQVLAKRRAPAADPGANRAMMNRISGRGGPKNLPRTLHGVLQRLAGTMQTREG